MILCHHGASVAPDPFEDLPSIFHHHGAYVAPDPFEDLPSGSPTIVGDSHHLSENCGGLKFSFQLSNNWLIILHNCLHTKMIRIFLFLPSPNARVGPTFENWMCNKQLCILCKKQYNIVCCDISINNVLNSLPIRIIVHHPSILQLVGSFVSPLCTLGNALVIRGSTCTIHHANNTMTTRQL